MYNVDLCSWICIFILFFHVWTSSIMQWHVVVGSVLLDAHTSRFEVDSPKIHPLDWPEEVNLEVQVVNTPWNQCLQTLKKDHTHILHIRWSSNINQYAFIILDKHGSLYQFGKKLMILVWLFQTPLILHMHIRDQYHVWSSLLHSMITCLQQSTNSKFRQHYYYLNFIHT